MYFRLSLISLGLCMLFSLLSCNKYEEGPAISLLSPEKRICRDWYLNYAKVNGVLVDPVKVEWLRASSDTSFISMFDELVIEQMLLATASFEKDGDGKFFFFSNLPSFNLVPIKYFSWSLDVTGENILMYYLGDSFTLKIIRLTKNEMILRRIETRIGEQVVTELEFICAKRNSTEVAD
jgi:hypothetical protein